MRAKANLAVVTGALVVVGVIPPALGAWAASPAVGAGLFAATLILGVALAALTLSTDAVHGVSLGVVASGAAAGWLLGASPWPLGSERGLPGLAGGLAATAPALLLALWLLLRRPVGDLSELPTEEVVRQGLLAQTALPAAAAVLGSRPGALEAVAAALPEATGPRLARALKLVGACGKHAPGRASSLLQQAAPRLTRHDQQRALLDAAATLAHPDLCDLLRRLDAPPALSYSLLGARAACGDVEVVDATLSGELDPEEALMLVERLGAAALPALRDALAAASSPERTAVLLSLVPACGPSDETFQLAAGYADSETPRVRARALAALGAIDPARARPLAESARDADDSLVRMTAESILRS